MKHIHRLATALIAGIVVLAASGKLRAQSDFPSWHIGLGGGGIVYEGDEATKGGLDVLLRLGYDYTPRWTFRGEVSYFPELKANPVYNYDSGVPVLRSGLDGDSTWAVGLAGDALFHLIADEDRRVDPYLIGGIGLLHYEKSRAWRSQTDVPLRAGIGVAYHVTPAWAVNVDIMGQMTLDHLEFNAIPSAGISWSPFTHKAARPAIGAPPAAPAPTDLKTFDLVMNFAEGQWKISPEYFMELDAIAKVIEGYPGSVVLIEGHIDLQPKLSAKAAQRLTKKRAEALRNYFLENYPFSRKRITTVGYGFSQPKKPNDPVTGNIENRRMIIHIRAEPDSYRE